MDRTALHDQFATAIAHLDRGDPIAAWEVCGDAGDAIRNLPSPLDRAILIGRLGLVARTGGGGGGTELGAVLQRLESVCCALDDHPKLP